MSVAPTSGGLKTRSGPLSSDADDGSVVRRWSHAARESQHPSFRLRRQFRQKRSPIGAAMSAQSVARQVEELKTRVTALEQLPARFDALEG